MNTCIFHVGMPKTGTTAIQDSLFYGMTDTDFRYVDLGEPNSSRGLATLFCNPRTYFENLQLGLTEEKTEKKRTLYHRRLERCVERASSLGQTLILSAEHGWFMSKVELEALRGFMEQRGFTVKVFAYLRPWKAWMEGFHSQMFASVGKRSFEFEPWLTKGIDYNIRLERMEEVFGRSRVEACIYAPENFPNGCVVMDFCSRIGVGFESSLVRRSNTGLSLPAIRFLYTYRKFGPGFGKGRMAVIRNRLLLKRLSLLKGAPYRLHSSIIMPLLKNHESQRNLLEERFQRPFREDFEKNDDGDTIRDESDMFRYDNKSLEWLASAVGGTPDSDPMSVCRQMHLLYKRPYPGFLLGIAVEQAGLASSRVHTSTVRWLKLLKRDRRA